MSGSDLKLPVKVAPFDHQKKAFEFVLWLFGMMDGMVRSTGAALLMQMGTGKSFVSVAVAGWMFLHRRIKRLLVVCPLSITGVWQDEFSKYADFPFSLTVLSGTLPKKKKQLAELPEDGLQVVVVNYESAWRMEKELLAYRADMIICDEGHKLKEGRTAQSKGMHKLGDKAKYRMLLTGTVITNREIDVFSQYRFVAPQVFGSSFFAFRNRYFFMSGYGGHTPYFRKSMTDEFLKRMHSIAFRVRKDECLDLPEVTEEIRMVDLEPEAAKLYTQIEEESYAEMQDSEVTAANVLTRILRLSQITGGFLKDDDGNVFTANEDGTITIPGRTYTKDQVVNLTAQWAPKDTSTVMQNGRIDITLHGGEMATFKDIPAGTAYEVWEDTPKGWILVSKVDDAGRIVPLETADAVFTNEYAPNKVSASLTASKWFDDELSKKEFTFQLFEKKNEEWELIQEKDLKNRNLMK